MDNINPEHYKQFNKEVIEIIQYTLTPEQFIGFLTGNELKYRFRAGVKTDDFNEDMKKATWYRDKRRQFIQDNGGQNG